MRTNRILEDPGHPTLARAKAKASDVIVEHDSVGPVRPSISSYFLRRQFHRRSPIGEETGKKRAGAPVAVRRYGQTESLAAAPPLIKRLALPWQRGVTLPNRGFQLWKLK